MVIKKKLIKAENGTIVKNKKVINKNSISGSRDDGSTVKTKIRTVYDNTGTKENPVVTNQRSRIKKTETDASGKSITTVRRVNSDGEITTRRAIIPVKKKGGIIKNTKIPKGSHMMPNGKIMKDSAHKKTIKKK